jgi:hypothetical protein
MRKEAERKLHVRDNCQGGIEDNTMVRVTRREA